MKFKKINRNRGIVPRSPHQTGTILSIGTTEFLPAKVDSPTKAPAHINTEPAKRGQFRKRQKEDGQPYRDRFLVNDGVRSRVSTYVNRDTHEKIKRFLSNAAPDISAVSYINNILVHHLEQYEDEMSDLYDRNYRKPF